MPTLKPSNPVPASIDSLVLPEALGTGSHTLTWTGSSFTKPNIALPPGTHLVTWVAKDAEGTEATITQAIIVADGASPIFDAFTLTPRTIEVPADGAQTLITAASMGVTATDTVDSDVTITPHISMLDVGKTSVKWTARDDAGNTSMGQQEITVEDKTKPIIECKTPYTGEATAKVSTITPELAGITATDNVDDSSDITIARTSELETLGLDGMATVTWQATDSSGNQSDVCTQELTVKDRTPPSISPNPPPNVTVNSIHITPKSAMITIADHNGVDDMPKITANPSTLEPGKQTVMWIVTDASKRSAEAIQSVTLGFAVTSLEWDNNRIDITFSKPVNSDTIDGIKTGKWGHIDARTSSDQYVTGGLISTITTTGNVVRIAPTLTTENAGTNKFYGSYGTSPTNTIGGALFGPWIISIPGTVSSTDGERLYGETTPTLKQCVGSVVGGWEVNRGPTDTIGCVAYINRIGQPGQAIYLWSGDAVPAGTGAGAAGAATAGTNSTAAVTVPPAPAPVPAPQTQSVEFTIGGLDGASVAKGQSQTFDVTVTRVAGDGIALVLLSDQPDFVTVQNTDFNRATITVNAAHAAATVGEHSFKVTASAGLTHSASQSVTITVVDST